MAQANPGSPVVNLRRDQWASGLVNSAQIASQDVATDLERLTSDVKLVSQSSDLLLIEGSVDLDSPSTGFCNTRKICFAEEAAGQNCKLKSHL